MTRYTTAIEINNNPKYEYPIIEVSESSSPIRNGNIIKENIPKIPNTANNSTFPVSSSFFMIYVICGLCFAFSLVRVYMLCLELKYKLLVFF